MREADLRSLSDDYLPVTVSIMCDKVGGAAPYRMRRVANNRTKPRLEPLRSDYDAALRQLPHISFATGPIPHHRIMTSDFEQALQTVCGAPAPLTTQFHIHENTVALCQVKGSFLDAKRL